MEGVSLVCHVECSCSKVKKKNPISALKPLDMSSLFLIGVKCRYRGVFAFIKYTAGNQSVSTIIRQQMNNSKVNVTQLQVQSL